MYTKNDIDARQTVNALANTKKFQIDSEDKPRKYKGPQKRKTNHIINQKWSAIKTFAIYRKYSIIYNLRVHSNNVISTVKSSNMKNIFYEQATKFKIQASLGFVLYDNTNDLMRYWHASGNQDRLFESPIMIENERDFEKFIEKLNNKDFIENATKVRPNTKYSLHLITNVAIYVYPIKDHAIGCPTALPQWLKDNKAIVCADLDSNGREYNNNLCLFRAIALFRKQQQNLETVTKLYFQLFLEKTGIPECDYKGIRLTQLPQIERMLNISITVLSMKENENGEQFAYLVSRSSTKFKEKIYLHLQNDHFSWVKNLNLYTKSYKCEYCSKLLRCLRDLNNHVLSCSTDTKVVYPAGVYLPPKDVFEKLDELGIVVDQPRRHYPYLAVFDCETYLDTGDLPKCTPTIEWKGMHRLASVSVCSNVPQYTVPVTFLNEYNNEYEVVKKMMAYLEQISDHCYENLKIAYKDIFMKINQVKIDCIRKETITPEGDVKSLNAKFVQLEAELDAYLRDLLCFGFQSKGFDIPVMKEHIVKYLIDTNSKINLIVKKGNKYMAILTDKLRFLDISNYLPQGFSLAEYLKAMEVKTGKFFWIYEQFTSMKVLERTTFPEHREFYSNLKQKNITIEEYNYAKSVWKNKKMKSLKDMLIYYNEQDVQPLCTAIEKQNEFFKSRNLDFKSAISIPGMSIKYLFQLKCLNSPIFMFGNKFNDVYHLIRRNIRGGLSIVFNRYQESGVTKIKSKYFGKNANTTKTCEGWDCSAMYLHNLAMCDMPTGAFIRRRREHNFCMEKSYNKGVKATEWIMWVGKIISAEFQHMFNGNEKRIGGRNICVDGYTKLPNGEEIVLNFSGCWYHSHMCESCPIGRNKEKLKDLENQLETYKKLKYFEDLGYTVYHIWECEFDDMKSKSKEISEFCKRSNIEVDKRYKVTESQIIKDVIEGKIFGMVEVDIHTPEKYKDLYSEFQPISKHAMISRDDIGKQMKIFAQDNELLKNPMKTLLNSYYANKILIATPLLRWYLTHGLVCTKVYQVLQYKPSKCFQKFAKEVVKARLDGDQDPSKKIISDNCKLIGMLINTTNAFK